MRLDVALVDRGLARSRNQAAALVAAGDVLVDGVVVRKPSARVLETQQLTVATRPWVSRAAHKLIGALDASGLQVPARVLDAGASTGGFTQVCLDRGARQVYADDVGHAQLAQEIRDDPRVVVREGLNLRDLTLADVDGAPVDLAVGDVSFISLKLLLEPLFSVCAGPALLLVKPQFEVGRGHLSEGIVTDPRLREAAVAGVEEEARRLGWTPSWRSESALPGAHGNVEYFVLFQRGPSPSQ